MLPGARLRDHALFAHVLGDQRLPDRVVDFVRAGVIQVLALEIDLRPTQLLRPAFGVIQWARPAHEMLQRPVQFPLELGVRTQMVIGRTQFGKRCHQGLGDECAAIRAKVPALVGQGPVLRFRCGRHGEPPR